MLHVMTISGLVCTANNFMVCSLDHPSLQSTFPSSHFARAFPSFPNTNYASQLLARTFCTHVDHLFGWESNPSSRARKEAALLSGLLRNYMFNRVFYLYSDKLKWHNTYSSLTLKRAFYKNYSYLRTEEINFSCTLEG